MRKVWAFIALGLGAWGIATIFSFSPLSYTGSDLQSASVSAILQNKDPLVYFSRPLAPKLNISAKAYLVGDLDSGETIFAKGEKEILPIASVSKIMTALTAEEYLLEGAVAQVSKKALATEGGNGGLHTGEKIKTADLIYPLLMQSSNDAAEVLAERLGREIFIAKMNERARELLMLSTSYFDPSGLSAGNRSTVTDLFRLAKYLYDSRKNLLDITTQRSHTNGVHTWPSNNQFLQKDGYLGGKSGFTGEARQTVISLFRAPLLSGGPRNIGIALLGSSDRKRDVENILRYLNKNINFGIKEEAPPPAVVVKPETVIEAIPTKPEEPEYVSLVFAGDIMLNRGVRNSVMKNFSGDYSRLFEKMDILKNADIAFANLEGVASDKGADIGNLYSFRMDPEVIPALRGAGISVLSVANNHVGDWGRAAYEDTLSRLKENEILYTGGGLNREEAEKPVIIEKYGTKIGFLGFSDKGPEFMKSIDNSSGILLANDPELPQIIKNAATKVDFLIVSFHFGEEYVEKHNTRQAELAHLAIDNGAKLVIGHHPHVIEDTEVYDNGYIAYSLGNFIFDQKFSTATMQGMLLGVKLFKNGTLAVQKNTVKLSPYFQPNQIIYGKEEKINFTQ